MQISRVGQVNSDQKDDFLLNFPDQTFSAGGDFMYDSADDIIYFDPEVLPTHQGQLALLHEVAHAQLGHFHYRSDFELFAMETKAWSKTRDLAKDYDIDISEDYIADCLASYGDWLTKRATCPTCQNYSLQADETTYQCWRCQTRWRVAVDSLDRIRRERIQ